MIEFFLWWTWQKLEEIIIFLSAGMGVSAPGCFRVETLVGTGYRQRHILQGPATLLPCQTPVQQTLRRNVICCVPCGCLPSIRKMLVVFLNVACSTWLVSKEHVCVANVASSPSRGRAVVWCGRRCASGWKSLYFSVRGTSVFWHNGGKFKGLL